MKYTITKEQIKAIRICMGYNADLRVRLKTANSESIYDFVDKIFPYLFGVETGFKRLDDDGNLSYQYEKAVYKCVSAVKSGHEYIFEL
jgi:hypothetical protein